METISMTTVSERRIIREIDEEPKNIYSTTNVPPGGSPISGILKGGRLWKQTSLDSTNPNKNDNQQVKLIRINYYIISFLLILFNQNLGHDFVFISYLYLFI